MGFLAFFVMSTLDKKYICILGIVHFEIIILEYVKAQLIK